MVGVAVKLTGVVAQTGPEGFATNATAGLRVGLTIMETAFELATSGAAQARLEVMITCTISPLERDEEV